MPKFCVKIKEVYTQIIEVEAENEQDAQGVAEDVVATGVLQDGNELPGESKYDYTLDRDEWDVWSSE